MNWEMFSTIGYASVLLWVSIPLFWLVHLLLNSRGWLAHVPLALGTAAVVLALVNSKTHVANIAIDTSEQEAQRLSAAQMAHDQAIAERKEQAAGVMFAEDTQLDRMDAGGMDDADLAFHQRLADKATPEWQRNRVDRDLSANDTQDLEDMIGASTDDRPPVEADEFEEPEEVKQVLMSEADLKTADRLDEVNRNGAMIMLGLAVLFVGFDWARRLNDPRKAYLPLPVPSALPNALQKRPVVSTRPAKPKRPLASELQRLVRRGEPFVLFTPDRSLADSLVGTLPRLPGGIWPMQVVDPADNDALTDDVLFEAVWFSRHGIVVQDPDRAMRLLEHVALRLSERRVSRAHTRQTVHLVWDRSEPITDPLLSRLAALGEATGVLLLLSQPASAAENRS